MKKLTLMAVAMLLTAVVAFGIVGCKPKDEEKVTSFKYFGMATGVTDSEYNSHELATMIKTQTGYDVKYYQASADAAAAQEAVLNIFINRDDFQAVKVTKDQFYTLLSQGALKPITDYVNKSTQLKSAISKIGWDTASKDGQIYAIPQKDAMMVSAVAIAYRADWLNEYNTANPSAAIPVPSADNNYSMTTANYKKMLQFFRTKVVTNGKALKVDVGGVFLENILPAFGIYQEWAEVNGQLQFTVNQPGYEAYMAYVQDLYDSGLVDYAATSTETNVINALKGGLAGSGRLAHWSAAAVEGADGDDRFGYIQALVPTEGAAVRTFAAEAYGYYTVIPAYASNAQAEAVIDWADKKLEPTFFKTLIIGNEGEHYEMKNGEVWPLLPKFNERNIADKFMDGTIEAEYTNYWLGRTRKTAAQAKIFSIANYNITGTGIKNPIVIMPPNSIYDLNMSPARTALVNKLITTLYNADVSKRSGIEELKTTFNSNKGSEITTSVNSWYTTWENKATYNAVKPR